MQYLGGVPFVIERVSRLSPAPLVGASQSDQPPVTRFGGNLVAAGGRVEPAQPPAGLPDRKVIGVGVQEAVLQPLLARQVVCNEAAQPDETGKRDEELQPHGGVSAPQPTEAGHGQVAVPRVQEVVVDLVGRQNLTPCVGLEVHEGERHPHEGRTDHRGDVQPDRNAEVATVEGGRHAGDEQRQEHVAREVGVELPTRAQRRPVRTEHDTQYLRQDRRDKHADDKRQPKPTPHNPLQWCEQVIHGRNSLSLEMAKGVSALCLQGTNQIYYSIFM